MERLSAALPADGNWFARLKQGLSRTKQGLLGPLEDLLRRGRIDEEFYADLEAALIQADVGVPTADKLLSRLREKVRQQRLSDPGQIKGLLAGKPAAGNFDEQSVLRLRPAFQHRQRPGVHLV